MSKIEECITQFIHGEVPLETNSYALTDSGVLSDTYGFVEYMKDGQRRLVAIWLAEDGGCNVLDTPVEY